MGKYFGTYGFRGEAGITLTADHAYKVGRFRAGITICSVGATATMSLPRPEKVYPTIFEAADDISQDIIASSKIAVTLDNCSKKWYNISQGDEKNGQNAAQ